MTWYRTSFKTPDLSLFFDKDILNDKNTITGVLLMDIGANGQGMQRGHWWLNGRDMGHYNNVIQSSNKIMVQQYYFIPLDYLETIVNNTLVFQEEIPFENQTRWTEVNVVYSTFVIPTR